MVFTFSRISVDDECDIRTSDLYISMQRLFRSMMICGLFTSRPWSPNAQFTSEQKQSWATISSRIYSTVVLIMHWLNCIRLLAIFMGSSSFDSELFANVTVLSWNCACALGCTVMYTVCNRPNNNIWAFLHKWKLLSNSSKCAAVLKKNTTQYTVIGWILYDGSYVTYTNNIGLWCRCRYITTYTNIDLWCRCRQNQHITTYTNIYLWCRCRWNLHIRDLHQHRLMM